MRLTRNARGADAVRQAEESSGALAESQAFHSGKARAERTRMSKVEKAYCGIRALADVGGHGRLRNGIQCILRRG